MRQIETITLTTAGILILLLAGCETDILDLPAPPDPELQASIIAARYMAGDYPDAIDSTRGGSHVIYHWK